ncbi:glycine cleavage system protein H, partial [Pseudomonas aeruginosa]|nr:glycine cleavage system protein H [Pseudomonas aeruginosa]
LASSAASDVYKRQAREAFAERMRLDGFDPQHPGVQALDF